MNNNQDLKTKEFTLRPDDAKAWSCVSSYLTKYDSENLGVVITHLGKVRTVTQNSSIHKYCSMLAIAMNDAGHYYVETLFGLEVVMPWTQGLVKEKIWHVVQWVEYPHACAKDGSPSTAALNTVEVGEVYKIISQNIAAERGVDVPWPSARG